MKRVITGLIALACIFALFFSEYNVFNTRSQYAKVKDSMTSFGRIRETSDIARQTLESVQKNFDKERTSEIYYGNVERLITVLDNIASISVSGWEPCSAENNFIAVPNAGEGYTAARISLVVDNVEVALNIIDRA